VKPASSQLIPCTQITHSKLKILVSYELIHRNIQLGQLLKTISASIGIELFRNKQAFINDGFDLVRIFFGCSSIRLAMVLPWAPTPKIAIFFIFYSL
jgi:hypothetical protein